MCVCVRAHMCVCVCVCAHMCVYSCVLDCHSPCEVEVSSIHEIRHGRHSELLRGLEVHEPDECIFTIVHSVDFQCMDLIAETPETATTWVMGLQYILHSANPPASCKSIVNVSIHWPCSPLPYRRLGMRSVRCDQNLWYSRMHMKHTT